MKEQMREAFAKAKIYLNQVEQEAWKNGFVQGYQAALSAVPANHKLTQAVNALAAQTGESAASITEWLTDKGGLTTLMLSHFGGMAQQPAQEPVAFRVIASANGEVVRDSLEFTRMSEIDEKVVRKSYELQIIPLYSSAQEPAKIEHHAVCDRRYPSLCDACNAEAQQPAQEPIYQLKMNNGSWIDQERGSYEYNVKNGHEVRIVYPKPAQEPVKQESWISVEEAKATLKDGDLIFAYHDSCGVIEATYALEEGYWNPHRIVKNNGDSFRINVFTNFMVRKPATLPLPPVKEVTE